MSFKRTTLGWFFMGEILLIDQYKDLMKNSSQRLSQEQGRYKDHLNSFFNVTL